MSAPLALRYKASLNSTNAYHKTQKNAVTLHKPPSESRPAQASVAFSKHPQGAFPIAQLITETT